MGTVNAGLFSSTTDEWPTPADLFAALDAEFAFDLDPCASAENAKCPRYFTREDDGLSQQWTGSVYVNPPYGRVLGSWVRKSFESSQAGATVVCLIPARTDTAYWHDYVMRADEVRFIRGRLHFAYPGHDERVAEGKSAAHNAPFPSALVVFRPPMRFPRMVSADRLGRIVGEVAQPVQLELISGVA